MSGINSVTYEDAVIPAASDTVNDPSGPFAGFYAGATGDVKVTTLRNTDVLFKAVPVGSTIRIAFKRLWSTGTGSPSLILGLKQQPYGK